MLARLKLMRTDYLRQAEELAHFVQSTKIELHGKHIGKDVVNTVHNERREVRKVRPDGRKNCHFVGKCYKCGKPGHTKAACSESSTKTRATDEVDCILAIDDSSVKDIYWILCSGSSSHLVNDVSMLEDPDNFCLRVRSCGWGTSPHNESRE